MRKNATGIDHKRIISAGVAVVNLRSKTSSRDVRGEQGSSGGERESRCEHLCQSRVIQLPLFHDHRPEPSQRWQQTLSIGDSKIEQETDQGIGCGVSADFTEVRRIRRKIRSEL